MTTPFDDLIPEFIKHCKEKLEEFEKTEVKCGVIGPSGSGKSSLINAIAGEKIAPTGIVETTNEPQKYSHKGLIFVDLPGCGTKKWPKANYIDRLDLLNYDCFLLVTADRFTENDIFLFRELSGSKPCFVIRNKFDRAVEDALHDNGHSEEEVRHQIEEDIRGNLNPSMPEHVYLTSARYPAKYDLRKLLIHISDALSGMKRNRFEADMAAYSEEALKKKREVVMGLIPVYAGLAAANGLNPVPGLDIATDISILIKLGHTVADIYGLTAKKFEFMERLLGPKAIPSLMAKVAQFAAKYLAKEGIILILKRMATRITAKQVSKWVPFVGPLISAGIGWKATFMLAEDMVDEAENLAREILEAIIRGSEAPHP